MNSSNTLEIDVHELTHKLYSDEPFVLLDMREDRELNKAKITDSRFQITPTSRLAQLGIKALSDEFWEKDVEILVLCHHGIRST